MWQTKKKRMKNGSRPRRAQESLGGESSRNSCDGMIHPKWRRRSQKDMNEFSSTLMAQFQAIKSGSLHGRGAWVAVLFKSSSVESSATRLENSCRE